MDIKNKILDICHNYFSYLLSLENVTGVGLGNKYINNIHTNELCIHVLVDEKINTKYVNSNNIIPKTFMGIKTDVIEIGKPKICSNDILTSKVRPLEGGYSIECDGLFGTLGCIVTNIKKDEKIYYILSNNHVIADSTIPSDTEEIPIGTPIIQPAEIHGGTDTDEIAYLETCIPILIKQNSSGPINQVDCAIAKITNKQLLSNLIAKIGKIEGKSKAKVDLKVKKSGMTTGMTEGIITTVGTSMTVALDEEGKSAIFTNQILADLRNEEGDSGSVVLNEDNKVLGLLFAGTEKGIAIINDIDIVLEHLNVDIYTG